LSIPIAKKIKEQVLSQWIQGISRDAIATNIEIGTGTVSNIMQQYKIVIPDIDLIRQTALQLKKENLDIFSLAASIRLRKLLEQFQLTEEQIESFLEEIDIHCFKKQISPKDFVLKVNEVSDIARDLKCPIQKIPLFVNQLNIQKANLEKDITNKRQQYSQLVREYEKYKDELKEFRAKRHLLPRINELEQLLSNKDKTISLASKEASDLATENYHLKAILAKDDLIPYEINEANKKLLVLYGDNKLIDKKEIAVIVHELYHYPSDHINVIKTMREHIKQQQLEIEKTTDVFENQV
jgi:hypothetical protein